LFNHSYIYTRQWTEASKEATQGFIKIKYLQEGSAPKKQDKTHTNSVVGLNPQSKLAQYVIASYSVDNIFEFQIRKKEIILMPAHSINKVAVFTKKLDERDTRWALKGMNFTLSSPKSSFSSLESQMEGEAIEAMHLMGQ
jgi:hypothetical protein